MSSSAPDDYVGLVTPWKPMADFALKNITSVHDRVEIDHGIKDGDVAKTDSIDATMGIDDNDVERENAEIRERDNLLFNAIIGGGAQDDSGVFEDDYGVEDSGIADIDNTDVDGSISDGGQADGAEVVDTDNDEPQHIDSKCVAVSTCVANSGDHRKVVSHIFGRNKACTRGLPNNLWIFWCRKHYQRFKYRAEDAENWHTIQLGLVRNQLQVFEDYGQVRTWIITLRKAEQDALAKENKNGITYTNYISSCWERFLVPYLGPNKTFAQVREVLNVIEGKFNEAEYRNREKKLKTFPGVEFLPVVQKAKEVKKPAAKKGEIAYKKITLDQPVFNRKTRANSQLIKDMAAKKAEASSTRKGSGTPSKKAKSPGTADDASDASATKKRKTSPPANATDGTAHHKRESLDPTTPEAPSSSTFQFKPLPTKRRRLTRGYEKHGSESEDTTLMEMEDQE